MTQSEFNEKYKDFIEEGFNGLDLTNEKLIEHLDHFFKIFVRNFPTFKFKQITYDFDYKVRSNLEAKTNTTVERRIKEMAKHVEEEIRGED